MLPVVQEVAIDVVAGVTVGIVSSPLVYALWRARSAPMIAGVSRGAWRKSFIAAGAGSVALLVAGATVQSDRLSSAATTVGGVALALCAWATVAYTVTRVAAAQERRAAGGKS